MKLKITVHGVAYEVEVEVLDPGEGFPQAGALPAVRSSGGSQTSGAPPSPSQSSPPPRPSESAPSKAPAGATGGKDLGGSVASPIAGTVVELKAEVGDQVSKGQTLLVVEAMKMNTSIAAPASGKIKAIPVAAGDSVREGQILVELE